MAVRSNLQEIHHATLPDRLVPELLRYVWNSGQDAQGVHRLEQLLKDYERQRKVGLASLSEPAFENGKDAKGFASMVISAAAIVTEWMKPDTNLDNAGSMLTGLVVTIGQIDDLVAKAALFPSGLKYFGEPGGSDVVTWRVVEALSRLRITREVEDCPPLHTELACAVARGQISEGELVGFVDTLEKGQTATLLANQMIFGISNSPREMREKWVLGAGK